MHVVLLCFYGAGAWCSAQRLVFTQHARASVLLVCSMPGWCRPGFGTCAVTRCFHIVCFFFAVIAIIEVEGQKFCLDGSVQDDFHALQSELCLGLDALVNFGQRMP
jgi:hypothetical protein